MEIPIVVHLVGMRLFAEAAITVSLTEHLVGHLWRQVLVGSPLMRCQGCYNSRHYSNLVRPSQVDQSKC